MFSFMDFLLLVKDLKSQLTVLSDENISLESHAKKLRTELESAEETREVRTSVSLGQVRVNKRPRYLLNEAFAEKKTGSCIAVGPQSQHCCIVVVRHHSCTTALL